MVISTKPRLATVGSATVAVLSQSFDMERPFLCHEMGSRAKCAVYRKVVQTTVPWLLVL